MTDNNTLLRAAETAARQAAAELEALGEGGLRDVKAARELCGALKDLLALERELRGGEAAEIVVRFEGETRQAAG